MSQSDFWNERYSQEAFVYGQEPNEYLKEKLENLESGKALFVAEGEGRNAVYAATKGWDVTAFDASSSGKNKAEILAKANQVDFTYQVTDVENFAHPEAHFDLLVMIYAHFPAENRREYHQKLSTYLKKDGLLILEGFSKKHVENQRENPNAGGPKNIEMLYDLDALAKDFENFDFIELEEKTVELNEGENHCGKAAVIRILAKKK